VPLLWRERPLNRSFIWLDGSQNTVAENWRTSPLSTTGRFAGRVSIVTGAASGIGYGIAKAFAHEGGQVVVADLNQNASEEAAAQLARATGGLVSGVAMDVANEASVEEAIETVVNAYGRVDTLVSNAGIQVISSLDRLTFTDWKRAVSVHLDGAFLTTRACLRSMYAAGRGGAIIYIGSVHSKVASILKGPYVAAKHGLLGLCRVVAKEGAPHGVRANIICPGFVRTPLLDKQIPEQVSLRQLSEAALLDSMLQETVDHEFTTIEEVADVALFLASYRGLALTGQSLVVSHGWVME
jgi:3-hydroxybutyrate dehydrogenase